MKLGLEKPPDHAPVIEQELKDASVEVGDDLELVCTYTGQPIPRLEWKKNGKDIITSKRVEVVEREGKTMLRILAVRRSDSGEYTVILTNKEGSATSSANLSIQGNI